MDTGKSLRMFQAELNLTNKDVCKTMGFNENKMSKLRNGKLMTGFEIIAFSDYFGVSCSEFIKKGEGDES